MFIVARLVASIVSTTVVALGWILKAAAILFVYLCWLLFIAPLHAAARALR